MAWAFASATPDAEPEWGLSSCTGCLVVGRRLVGVKHWWFDPLWLSAILLDDERFEIRPRIRISTQVMCWVNLDGWPGSVDERRWPGPAVYPAAFAEHVLTRPDDWMRDVERQDMRRILGGPARS